MALFKPAYQSSASHPSTKAALGVDDKKLDSCSQTMNDNDTHHWWIVDLGKPYKIREVYFEVGLPGNN